jgi:hypothetical protein
MVARIAAARLRRLPATPVGGRMSVQRVKERLSCERDWYSTSRGTSEIIFFIAAVTAVRSNPILNFPLPDNTDAPGLGKTCRSKSAHPEEHSSNRCMGRTRWPSTREYRLCPASRLRALRPSPIRVTEGLGSNVVSPFLAKGGGGGESEEECCERCFHSSKLSPAIGVDEGDFSGGAGGLLPAPRCRSASGSRPSCGGRRWRFRAGLPKGDSRPSRRRRKGRLDTSSRRSGALRPP